MEFAFTLTLSPPQYKKKLKTQYRESLWQFNNIFDGSKDSPWRIIEAVPEVTKHLNLHIHGIIEYVGFVKLYYTPEMIFRDLFRDHSFFGFTYITQITDRPGWKEYIYKDQSNPIVQHLIKSQFVRYWHYSPPLGVNFVDNIEVVPIQLNPLDDGIKKHT